VHLHDIAVRLAARVTGPGRLVLVSDAMAAAGMPDGSYRLGSMQVRVAGGVARLRKDSGECGDADRTPGAGPIAGSTATLAGVVRHAIAAGLPVPEVAAAASTTPARVLGIADRTGALRRGLAADLIVCDDAFRPRAIMRQGQWLAGSAAALGEPAGR
jgi:N-acetylglucosamine-6-phosphate deacetylase